MRSAGSEERWQRRRRRTWTFFVLALLANFACIFVSAWLATNMGPAESVAASMLAQGQADYSAGTEAQFAPLDPAVATAAALDAIQLQLTAEALGDTPVVIGTRPPTRTATSSPTASPTVTSTPTPSASATSRPTLTGTVRPSATATPTDTAAPATSTRAPATPTRTPIPPSSTPWPTATNTPVPPPPPPTNTPLPPPPPTHTPLPPPSPTKTPVTPLPSVTVVPLTPSGN